jgi:hypothetical protein
MYDEHDNESSISYIVSQIEDFLDIAMGTNSPTHGVTPAKAGAYPEMLRVS